MIRALIGSTLGGLIIVAFTAWWLVYAIPAHGAEPCRGITGEASYYGIESCVRPPPNCRTANGERFTGMSLTAASRTLPFGARLRVTYEGRSVVVRISDRGPALWTGRMLDLSEAAARQLGMIPVGVASVCAELLG